MTEPSKTLQTIWVAAGQASTFLLGIVSSMVLARYLTKVDLATYRQVAYVHGTLAVVFTAGLPRIYSYFLPRNSMGAGPSIINKTMAALLALGSFFSLFLYFGSELIGGVLSNPLLPEALRAFAPIPLFLFPVMGIDGILATCKRTDALALYVFSSRLLMLIFILAPVILFNGTYIAAIHGWLIASIISLALGVLIQRLPYRNIKSEKTNVTYKEILAYSVPLVFASIWGTIIRSADQYFISRYFGPGVFAGYSLAMIEVPIVAMITSATSTVLFPYFSRVSQDPTAIAEMFLVWRSALAKAALFVYPTVIYCMIFATDIISFLYSAQYADAAIYFRIAMSVNLFNIVMFAPLILSVGKTKLYARVHMFAAAAIFAGMYLSVLFYPSAVGIAMIRMLTNIALVIFFMWKISGHFEIKLGELVPSRTLARIVAASLVAGAAAFCALAILDPAAPVLRLMVSAPIFAIVLLIIEYAYSLGLREILTPIMIEISRRRNR